MEVRGRGWRRGLVGPRVELGMGGQGTGLVGGALGVVGGRGLR